MTAERIEYFEKVLSKPQPEPHGAWMKELFEAVKGQAKPKQEPKPKTLYNPPKPDSDDNE